jgi:hypothetical protein
LLKIARRPWKKLALSVESKKLSNQLRRPRRTKNLNRRNRWLLKFLRKRLFRSRAKKRLNSKKRPSRASQVKKMKTGRKTLITISLKRLLPLQALSFLSGKTHPLMTNLYRSRLNLLLQRQ